MATAASVPGGSVRENFCTRPLPSAPPSRWPLVRAEAIRSGTAQKKEQQLLLDYARLAVTEENVALLARQALPPARR